MPVDELETTWDANTPSSLPWNKLDTSGVQNSLAGALGGIPEDFPLAIKAHATAFVERFWNDTHMSFEWKSWAYAWINIRTDSASEKAHPKTAEIAIAFWPDGLANMQVNPYAHEQEFYFKWEWLSSDDALEETATALAYLRGEISAIPQTSKLVQVDYDYDLSAYE